MDAYTRDPTIFEQTEKISRKRRKRGRRRNLNRHHRKPRCFGGSNTGSNIIRVKRRLHEAFHRIFGPGYPVASVAATLNAIYLSHDTCLVPVPTALVPGVLEYLSSRHEHPLREDEIGITPQHREIFQK